MSTSIYLHGTSTDEQARLAKLNDLLNEAALNEMALCPGDRVLDVGAGLGQLSRAMAFRIAPAPPIVAIERSGDQLKRAQTLSAEAGQESLVEFRQGGATQLPLRADEWSRFDVAHARFLLEHVPNPRAVVEAMGRAVRPAGRVILQDDPHDLLRLTPEPPGFGPLWHAYMRSFDRAGNDPLIGHRLVSLLVEAGLSPIRNTWLFFGSCAGEPELFQAHVANLIGIMNGVRPYLLQQELISGPAFEQAIDAIQTWRQRADAALWYAVAWAEGRRE